MANRAYFANGHGEDIYDTKAREFVKFTLPNNVWLITGEECGRAAEISSNNALEIFALSGPGELDLGEFTDTDWADVLEHEPKPGNEAYVRAIGRMFTLQNPKNVHIKGPGDSDAIDNWFIPASVLTYTKSVVSPSTLLDGACGLVRRDLLMKQPGTDDGTSPLVSRVSIKDKAFSLPSMYVASVYPTAKEVNDRILKKGNTYKVLNEDMHTPKDAGGFKIRISELANMISKAGGGVLFYPLCRVTSAPPEVVRKRVEESQEQYGLEEEYVPEEPVAKRVRRGGRRRKTHRKKKLRRNTRRKL